MFAEEGQDAQAIAMFDRYIAAARVQASPFLPMGGVGSTFMTRLPTSIGR